MVPTVSLITAMMSVSKSCRGVWFQTHTHQSQDSPWNRCFTHVPHKCTLDGGSDYIFYFIEGTDGWLRGPVWHWQHSANVTSAFSPGVHMLAEPHFTEHSTNLHSNRQKMEGIFIVGKKITVQCRFMGPRCSIDGLLYIQQGSTICCPHDMTLTALARGQTAWTMMPNSHWQTAFSTDSWSESCAVCRFVLKIGLYFHADMFFFIYRYTRE